jgi:hypothetical protein
MSSASTAAAAAAASHPYMDKLAQEMYQFEHGVNLTRLPSGFMGELLITRSGRVKFQMGAVEFDVCCCMVFVFALILLEDLINNCLSIFFSLNECLQVTEGTVSGFHQEVVSVQASEQKLYQLADVGKKMVVSLPLRDLEAGLGQ